MSDVVCIMNMVAYGLLFTLETVVPLCSTRSIMTRLVKALFLLNPLLLLGAVAYTFFANINGCRAVKEKDPPASWRDNRTF